MKEFAEIFVDSRIFTYSIPDDMQDLDVGSEVLVMLRKQKKSGYIIRFCSKPEFKTLPVLEPVDNKKYFDQNMVQLAEWIAEHYKCFPETALKMILPK